MKISSKFVSCDAGHKQTISFTEKDVGYRKHWKCGICGIASSFLVKEKWFKKAKA
jgi:hypothetical protein